MKCFVAPFLWLSFIGLPLACAADSPSGYVIGWGWNTSGEATGTPTGTSTDTVAGTVNISGRVLNDVIAISTGSFYTLGLKKDGTVAGWGSNHKVQATGSSPSDSPAFGVVTIDGQILTNISAIAAANSSTGLRHDGTLTAWGDIKMPVGLNNISAIAARGFLTCAVKCDGTVVEWSSEKQSQSYGQALPVSGLSNVAAVAVGGGGNVRRMLALGKDGTVKSWGGETIFKDATPPRDLIKVTAVAVGFNHSLERIK